MLVVAGCSTVDRRSQTGQFSVVFCGSDFASHLGIPFDIS